MAAQVMVQVGGHNLCIYNMTCLAVQVGTLVPNHHCCPKCCMLAFNTGI
jgi:hypothetical protein